MSELKRYEAVNPYEQPSESEHGEYYLADDVDKRIEELKQELEEKFALVKLQTILLNEYKRDEKLLKNSLTKLRCFNWDLEAYKFEAEKLADAVIRNNQLRMDGTHEQQLVKLNVMSLMLTLANKLKGGE